MRPQDNIKHLREYRNYSQTYMASQLGITQQAYSKIEAGSTQLTQVMAAKIAVVLDIEVSLIYQAASEPPFTETERELYERMLRDRDREIERNHRIIDALLRGEIPEDIRLNRLHSNNRKI